jgi:hypothetical protein
MYKYFTIGFFVLLINTSSAQPFSFDKKIKPKEILLHPLSKTDKTKGKLGIAKIKQVKDTAYYFCKGMGIYNPMVVKLVAKDKNTAIKVSLHKWNWSQPSREGQTKNGDYTESFVTEGSFGIKVVATAKLPATYNIYLHLAKQAPPKLPSAFKKAKNNNKPSK